MFSGAVHAHPYVPPGYTVRHYDTQSGLPQNSIKSVAIDGRGFLWIVTESGLVRFNGQHFQPVAIHAAHPSERLTAVISQEYGMVLAGSGNAVYQVNGLHSPQRCVPTAADRARLTQRSVIPAWNAYGTCRKKALQGQVPSWAVPDASRMEWSAQTTVVQAGGRLYFINNAHEIVQADTALTSFRKLNVRGLPAVTGPEARQHGLMTDQGELYVRRGDFIYRCHGAGDGSLQATPVLDVRGIKAVTLIHFSPANSMIVVGTQSSGLYIFIAQQFTTLRFRNPDENTFYAIAPFNDGVFTPKGILTGERQSALHGFSPYVAFRSSRNEYWLNHWLDTKESGLARFDSLGRPIGYIRGDVLRVSAMTELANGEIWLAAKGKFLARLSGDTISWLPASARFRDFLVADMERAGKDRLWVGGPRGLARVNLLSGEVDTVAEASQLPIRTVRRGPGNALWIGTYGKGSYLYHHDRLIALPMDPHGYLAHSHAFLFDGRGYCWISTNQGLLQARAEDVLGYADGLRNTVHYYYYDRGDGFQTNEFNGGGHRVAAQLDGGSFVFASMDGVVKFRPDSVKPHFSRHPITIEAWLGDSLLQPSGARLVLESPAAHLRFALSSPHWGNPLNNRLEYRLAGMDDAWQVAPPDGIIRYPVLGKGTYVLEARKVSGFGGRQTVGRLAFVVAPAWYETGYFYAALLLLGLALGWLLLRFRTRLILRQKKQLEKEVGQRTAEQQRLIARLKETVDALEGSEKQLMEKTQLQERLTMIIVHDVQSPLRFISDISNRIRQSEKKRSPEEMGVLLNDLYKSASTTHAFVRDFGLWLSSLEEGFVMTRQPVVLAELAGELQAFFHEQLSANRNRLLITIDPQLTLYIHRRMLQTVLRNLLDNANKNTEDGDISLIATTYDGNISITLSDTGRGFSEAMLTNVRKLLSARSMNRKGEIGAIYGFRYVTDFCHALGINVSIDSAPGKGTRIVLSGLTVASPTQRDSSIQNN